MTEKYAFPCGTEHLAEPVTAGMTLRDYFAAKAMEGMLATLIEVDGEPFWNVIATDSYKMADAMMKAREQ